MACKMESAYTAHHVLTIRTQSSRVGRATRLKTSLLRPRLLPSRVQLYDGDQTEHNAGGDHRGIGINIFHTSSRRYERETVGYPKRLARNV